MVKLRKQSLSDQSVIQREVRRQRANIIERTPPAPRQSRGFKSRRYLFLVAAFVLAAVIVLVLMFSDNFRVNRIIVVGNDSISDERVEEQIELEKDGTVWGIFPSSNIFFFNARRAEARLSDEIVQIRQVEIKRQMPDMLKVYIEEREPALVWQTGDRKYYLDLDGVISKLINDEPEFSLPQLRDESNREVQAKEKLVSKNFVDFAVSLAGTFKSETGLEYEELSTPAPISREVRVRTKLGWYIYFTSDRTLESQYQKLLLILNKELKKGQKENLEYIDLRIKDKIFYK